VVELLGENLSHSHKKRFVGEQQRKMTMSELTDQLHVDKCGNKITKIENVFLAKHKHYASHTIKYSYGQTNTTISWHVTEKTGHVQRCSATSSIPCSFAICKLASKIINPY